MVKRLRIHIVRPELAHRTAHMQPILNLLRRRTRQIFRRERVLGTIAIEDNRPLRANRKAVLTLHAPLLVLDEGIPVLARPQRTERTVA